MAARRAPTLLVSMATSGPSIAAAERSEPTTGNLAIHEMAADGPGEQRLAHAVGHAFAWAHEHGGVVLLSPASPGAPL